MPVRCKNAVAGMPVRSIDGIGPAKQKSLNENTIFTVADLASLLDDETRLLRVQEVEDRKMSEQGKAPWKVRHYAEIAFGNLLTHGITNGDSDSEDDDREEREG
jgi:nucleotidyltransferase/DNA polymerase involved in DNA repair